MGGIKISVPIEVVKTIILEAKRMDPLETTGPLYAPRNREGKVFDIVYAFGPGPNGQHEHITTHVDMDYFTRIQNEMWAKGYEIAGMWHSHPMFSSAWPSYWDIHGHPDYKDSMGWYRSNEINGFGDDGHIQIIVARKEIKAWHVLTNKHEVVWAAPYGIDLPV